MYCLATFGRIGGDFSSLGVLSILEEHIELAHEEVLGSRKVVTYSHAQRQLWILQHTVDVRYNVFLVHGDREHLALAVHSNYTTR